MRTVGHIGLVLHPRRDSAEAVAAILDWARQRRVQVLGLPEEVSRLGAEVQSTGADELVRRSDLVVSLGGDGTMLRALRLTRAHGVPVLGVNLGRLGFLAELDVPGLPAGLCSVETGSYTVERRLAVEAQFEGTAVVAFNDVALVRHPGHPVAAVEVLVEGQEFVRYSADAVIVATPTGSTAYAFSAGGPIVSPRAAGLLVIPSASHSAFDRAVFLSPQEPLRLQLLPGSGDLAVEVDGQLAGTVRAGSAVDVSLSAGSGKVIRLGQTTFYQRARRKLRLADPAELDGG